MHRPLLTQTRSSQRTSQVTQEKNSFPDRCSSTGYLDSCAADSFLAGSTRCRAITRATVRGSERDLVSHRQSRHRTPIPPRDLAARRQGARRRRLQLYRRLARERGTLRSGDRHMDGHRQPRQRTLLSHGDVTAQWQGARRSWREQQRLSCERGTLRPGQRNLNGHWQPRRGTHGSYGYLTAQWQGARRKRGWRPHERGTLRPD